MRKMICLLSFPTTISIYCPFISIKTKSLLTNLQIWNFGNKSQPITVQAHNDIIAHFDISKDENMLATLSFDKAVKVSLQQNAITKNYIIISSQYHVYGIECYKTNVQLQYLCCIHIVKFIVKQYKVATSSQRIAISIRLEQQHNKYHTEVEINVQLDV